MNKSAIDKLSIGFLFTMIDFKIMGFDILPDVVGYILFAVGFSSLAAFSDNFRTASYLNIPMMILSLFSIYERPAQQEGINLGTLGILGIPVAIAGFVLSLLVVYYLFRGIKDMAQSRGLFQLIEGADKRWNQFMLLQFAALFSIILIIIPILLIPFAIGMLIVTIMLTAAIMRFMKECGECL